MEWQERPPLSLATHRNCHITANAILLHVGLVLLLRLPAPTYGCAVLYNARRDAFANAIADLARRNMGSRAGEFDGYVQWLERNGPYDIMVDAANVAFFGQNREGGGFSWPQVIHMYELLRNRFPSKKILVVSWLDITGICWLGMYAGVCSP